MLVASAGPAAGGDEDDVEHPEGVHHPQDQSEKGRRQEQRQDDEPESLRPVRAVDRGGFENVGRAATSARRAGSAPSAASIPRRRWRPTWRARVSGRRASRAGPTAHWPRDSRACRIRGEQRPEDEPDHERRDGHGNQQEPERDAVKQASRHRSSARPRPRTNSSVTATKVNVEVLMIALRAAGR